MSHTFARLAFPFLALLCCQILTAQDRIRLRYASFDPLVSVPDVPAELRSPPSEGLWLVQFKSTPTRADRTAITACAGLVVKYVPDNAYVVFLPPDQVDHLVALADVRWIGSYHVAYRLEPALLAQKVWRDPAARRYHIVVANKYWDKPALIAQIRAIGGRVDDEHTGSILVDATLTGPQLLQVAGLDQVLWIDRWSPPELDMDNARIQGGGNYLENQTGYTGAGVNAHIYEGIEAGHVDFTGGATNVQSGGAPQQHGHCTAGIVFGNGTSNPAVRGMAPDCGKFYTEYQSVNVSRWQVFDDLVNIHNVSLTTASWGNAQTTAYTSISAESDDIVFDHDIPWTQSQSNTGTQQSRPQAWAKNVFSVGGVVHFDNSNPADDSWQAGNASRGPAADGRIKPTLCAYYDDIGASDLTGSAGYSGANWYASFGGTSGATPIVAGHGVLAIQMFTDETGTPGFGKFGNALRVPGGSAHENRPHFTTFKALMVCSAEQYPFTSASTDNRREHQGWGFPNLRNMWDRRGETFIVDETSVLEQGDSDVWQITVAPGEPSLKICLNWSEPAANPASAATLINNLSLRVLAPDGTLYWGNNGLEDGNWSVAGGNEDSVNSIENVFVQNPLAGDWYVQVLATAVVEDNHVETMAIDADYALVAVGGTGQPAPPGVFASAVPIGVGCDGTTCVDAIYEYPTFDLANTSLTFQYVNGDYMLVPGQGTWIPATGSNLGLSDNQEVIRNVGFTLPYPGGSTGTLRICANGWICDGQFTGSSNIVPSPQDFLQNTMWAPLWRDLNPGAGGSVWYDSTPQRLVITWLSVPNFFNNGSSTFQVQFWNNGDVHFVYQNINVQGDYLVGFTNAGASDPGSVDLSQNLNAGLSICSNPLPELELSASARPVLGTTFDLVTDNAPPGTLFGTMILSTNPLDPPFDLSALGMPGCLLHETLDVVVLWAPIGSSGTVTWPLPATPSLAGFTTYAQSATLTPGINAFGFAISNALRLIAGLN